jgi:catechol 2,3-dioxygenase-like lactoylglutathione lyase family enzyme
MEPWRLTHVRLLVGDFARAHAFYRDVVGLRPRFGDEGGERHPYEEFDLGPGTLALFDRDLMMEALGTPASVLAAPEHVGNTSVVCIGVEDVDAEYERLLAAGVRFVTEPHDQPGWVLRVAHFRDPEGNLIELGANLPAPASEGEGP